MVFIKKKNPLEINKRNENLKELEEMNYLIGVKKINKYVSTL